MKSKKRIIDEEFKNPKLVQQEQTQKAVVVGKIGPQKNNL